MLSTVLSNLLANDPENESLIVWIQACEAIDNALYGINLREGRKNGDITRDEYRAKMGFGPAEELSTRNKLLDTVGGMNGTGQWLGLMAQGLLPSSTVAELMVEFLGISIERARAIIGSSQARTDQDTLDDAIRALDAAVASLGVSPELIAQRIHSTTKGSLQNV
jgi:hypothetical protein